MSKSLKRVTEALSEAGLKIAPLEMSAETRTAQQAADVASCGVDQIAKSVILAGAQSGKAILFITAGRNKVDPAKASVAADEPVTNADAALIRHPTGFAIGGVAPIGHLHPIQAFIDATLLDFDTVYAAAGTPRHIFPIAPIFLLRFPTLKYLILLEIKSKCKKHLHLTLKTRRRLPISCHVKSIHIN